MFSFSFISFTVAETSEEVVDRHPSEGSTIQLKLLQLANVYKNCAILLGEYFSNGLFMKFTRKDTFPELRLVKKARYLTIFAG